jgi:hypothetical protein
MKNFKIVRTQFILVVVFNLLIPRLIAGQEIQPIPYLQKQGTATQLVVDGKPFLMLGGELGNSSSSNTAYMRSLWSTLKQMNVNTILAPVYWELIEPEEGKFDFSLLENLIFESRKRDIHLVLLWFGSWKNSMSCYAPAWVKNNFERFPRARDIKNNPVEILSPFIKTNLEADKKAFIELMKFVQTFDGIHHTVIMVQVENEIGMLPNARDYQPEAIRVFSENVPVELINYISKNREQLKPEFLEVWEKAGSKTVGTWKEVFGDNIGTEEIFMAWYFGKYTDDIARAGKDVYPIPMFVNAALNRPNKLPGEYPSAGPLPHLMDVWKAAAPSIDILSPDIYFPDFKHWCRLYDRGGNPLFIPEAKNEPASGSKVFYALGNHDAMGFSPFSIESTSDPIKEPIGVSYQILQQLAPVILEKQGRGLMKGFLLDKGDQSDTIQLGGYTIVIKHDFTLGWSPQAKDETWPIAGGMIMCMGEGEYYVAGDGIVLSFPCSSDGKECTGISMIEEGKFSNGIWTPLRRLNGDQSHQGRHLRISMNDPGIQFLKLYHYR